MMYEIDLSTLLLISEENNTTRVITYDGEFVVEENVKKIIDNSCRFFGNSLISRTKMTNNLINIVSKSPIVIEDTRNIIFFPLKSSRDKNNIWISFNNLKKYEQVNKKTLLHFKNDFDYLIDACDSINTKKCIIRECLKRSIPFISCMGTGNKLDPLKFKICDIRDTSYDPIAKIIRKYVKDSNIKEKVMVLCSDEPAKKVSGNISSISYMPVVAGNICASYIIRKILEDF